MASSTFEEAAANQDHLSMMLHPEWWPHRVFLPVRNRKMEPKNCPLMKRVIGVIIKGNGPLVYPGFPGHESFQKDNPFTYTSFTELLAADWEVD